MFTFDASDWEERGFASMTALFPNLRSVVVGGYEHLKDAYDGSGHRHKEPLPDVDRAHWKAFVHWVQKDMKNDTMVSFQSRIIF